MLSGYVLEPGPKAEKGCAVTSLTMTNTPKVAGIYESARRLTLQERLMLARMLLDSVLDEEVDDTADWVALSLASFERDCDNPEDAVYDNWRELYGVPTG